jgi:hypothetical protein
VTAAQEALQAREKMLSDVAAAARTVITVNTGIVTAAQEALQAREKMLSDVAAAARAANSMVTTISADIATAAHEALKALTSIPDPSQWMPRLPDMSLIAQQVARTQQHYRAVYESTSIGVLQEIERMRPIIDQYQQALREAPDEAAQRLTLNAAIRAVVEGATDLETRLTTPADRIKFVTKIVVILICILLDRQRDAEMKELRRDSAQQAAVTAAVVARLHELERAHGQDDLPTGLVLQVVDAARLREDPSTTYAPIRRLARGTRLEAIVLVDRWYYVELLSEDGHRTGLRGWIYRRVVRHDQ